MQHLVAAALVEHGDLLQRRQRHLLGAGVGEADVAQAHAETGPVRQRCAASGRSVIIGGRSSTSKTRSNDTSAVITSTRALASAVIGV